VTDEELRKTILQWWRHMMFCEVCWQGPGFYCDWSIRVRQRLDEEYVRRGCKGEC